MRTLINIGIIGLVVLSMNAFAMDQKQAAELFPVKITSIDPPKKNGYYSQIMMIHYEIENKGTKDVDAIKAGIVFENPDGTVFQSLTSDSLSIKAGGRASGDFGHGYDESSFDDKKMHKLGGKLKTWLRVEEIIYSDGSFETVTK